MIYLIYFSFGLLLVMLQTTFLSSLLIYINFYDLLLPFVLYLGLYRPVYEGLPIVILFGFIMDSLSGGPFGIYLSVYFWSYTGMRWLIRYLHAGSVILFPFISAFAVFLECFIIFLAIFVYEKKVTPAAFDMKILLCQALWAGISGPFFIVALHALQKKWNKWMDRVRITREA